MTEEKREILLKTPAQPLSRLEVTYRDKVELFQKYTEWLKSLNITLDLTSVFWCDGAGKHTGVMNVNELHSAVQGQEVLKLFIPDDNHENCWCSPDVKTEKMWIPGIHQSWLDINPNLTLDKIDCGCDDCMGPDFYEKLAAAEHR